jgi:hypothetical protein
MCIKEDQHASNIKVDQHASNGVTAKKNHAVDALRFSRYDRSVLFRRCPTL